jgi:hypothetical protein
VAAVFSSGAAATITNAGAITASGATGADIEAGGNLTNNAGGSISGTSFGVFMSGGGTITNAGSIAGGSYAVDFTTNAANRLVVDPGAVFTGGVNGGSGTLELASGSGTISGVDTGSFRNFQGLAVDSGGSWTLGGANTVANVLNNGSLTIGSSLIASSAVDPNSTGVFNLGSGSIFEVAADTGTQSLINFLGSSKLVVDNATSFGTNVGTPSYAGPQLQSFVAGDTIDLKNFGFAGASVNYNSATGVLQVSNGASQAASFEFQTSSLGAGSFHAASDGSNGILITHAFVGRGHGAL